VRRRTFITLLGAAPASAHQPNSIAGDGVHLEQ
jgi:hypothetical protein